jgi:serine/threonine protein kinase
MDDDATIVVDRQPNVPEVDLSTGSVVNRRFVIESVLGRGGMGVVYRARDLRKEETGDRDPYVALKVLSDEFRRDPRMAVALQREARKAQSLAHPNIATVYDFDRDDKIVYLTMEQLDGRPLDQVIRDNPEGLSRAEALPIVRGLCLGLAYAHNKNIVHSDFKPGNVFFTSSGQTRILDFGIARAAPAERLEASDTTRFDAAELGALTPSYAAPEMFEGKTPHPADDVYALAIVTYQLLSGRHPFGGTPAPQARNQSLEPAQIRGLKRREWRAIRRGLALERESRTQHAADFLRELEGGSRLKLVVSLAVLLGALFAGYVGYVQFQENARAAPDIPFEQLPGTTQDEINRLVEEAAMFRRFGDAGSALMLYRDAYALHPRNRQVVTELESLFSSLTVRAIEGGARDDLERLEENLSDIMDTDDFLDTRPALVNAREQVAAALGRFR